MVDKHRKGGLHDDVANNIRNEMQRDAVPSAEEAQRELRQQLAKEGCTVEGCDETNPDNLHHQMPHTHSCSAHQTGELRPEVVCDEHAGDTYKEWIENKKKVLKSDEVVAIVVYECDIVKVGKSKVDKKSVPNRYGSPPEVAVTCRCGSQIKNIYYDSDID